MNILIVDDNTENLYFLQSLLKGSGYNVKNALNGKEALKLLSERDFGLIISDILMPVMDGFELCRRIKKDEKLKGIPFVFYTATYTEKKDEEFALSLGASKFLKKPQEPEEFLKIVKDIIKNTKSDKIKSESIHLDDNKEIFKLYSERLVNKLEKKMLDLEKEIFERKRVEEELREKEYSIESSSSAIATTDLEGNMTYGNPAFLKTWGFDDAKEFLGRHFSDFWVVKDRLDEIMQALQSEGKWFDEIEARRKDGSLFNVQVSAAMVYDSKGNPIALTSTSIDITKRKRTEDELKKQLEELQRWHSVTIGREERIRELKLEVNELLARLSEPLRYSKQASSRANDKLDGFDNDGVKR